jgi:hypothetical protein
MSTDTAAVPEPVSVAVPTAPVAVAEAAQVDIVTKTAEEIAGMYNVVDWKKPVPTALAVFAHVSTMTALKDEERLKAVQHVIITIAKRSGTSEDESAATFFATQVLPHIVNAVETLSMGRMPSVEAVKDFGQKEMKAVFDLVVPEVKKVSSWCWK